MNMHLHSIHIMNSPLAQFHWLIHAFTWIGCNNKIVDLDGNGQAEKHDVPTRSKMARWASLEKNAFAQFYDDKGLIDESAMMGGLRHFDTRLSGPRRDPHALVPSAGVGC